jgi:FixJ family two-component response regulator
MRRCRIRESGYAAEHFRQRKNFSSAGFEKIRFLILDLAMRDMSGLDVHRKLRERGRRIPIISVYSA